MIPSLGRIVEYTLNERDVAYINRWRTDARTNQAIGETGFILHVGNDVEINDTYPLIITHIWGNTAESAVNGQVMLDGNDTLWVSSVQQGEGPGTFREFPRI